jgi:hypothetical protein
MADDVVNGDFAAADGYAAALVESSQVFTIFAIEEYYRIVG